MSTQRLSRTGRLSLTTYCGPEANISSNYRARLHIGELGSVDGGAVQHCGFIAVTQEEAALLAKDLLAFAKGPDNLSKA